MELVLPQMARLTKQIEGKEEAEVFVGTKGLMSAYEKLFGDGGGKDRYQFFYVHEPKYYEQAESFYLKWLSMLKRLRIAAYGISNEEYRLTHLAKASKNSIKQRYVPFPVPGNIEMFRDKTLIVSWREKPTAILITSRETAENTAKYFDAVWKIAKS